MIVYENECCNCSTAAYPCIGDSCKNIHVPHFYCDQCGEENVLYEFDGNQLCSACIVGHFDVVEGSYDL